MLGGLLKSVDCKTFSKMIVGLDSDSRICLGIVICECFGVEDVEGFLRGSRWEVQKEYRIHCSCVAVYFYGTTR